MSIDENEDEDINIVYNNIFYPKLKEGIFYLKNQEISEEINKTCYKKRENNDFYGGKSKKKGQKKGKKKAQKKRDRKSVV